MELFQLLVPKAEKNKWSLETNVVAGGASELPYEKPQTTPQLHISLSKVPGLLPHSEDMTSEKQIIWLQVSAPF